MFPLDKWHKGNPLVWLLFYFIGALIFVIVAAILSPLDIGVDLFPNILTILICIGAFFVFVVIVIASISFFSQSRSTNYRQYYYHKYIAPHLMIILRAIRNLSKSNQFSLIRKKIVNAIKFRHYPDE